MARTLIYAGPTLYGSGFIPQKGELLLPPAGQGDLFHGVLRYNPAQIVLIDGVFHQRLSVWIKEILFALVDGVRIIGASSMGALRAAEAWRYGMIGIGAIFEAYKSGFVEDEAWVAMTYDPETYRPLTEPHCGLAQKRLDALAAIEFARVTPIKQPQTNLKKEQVAPFFTPILDRVLEEDLLYA